MTHHEIRRLACGALLLPPVVSACGGGGGAAANSSSFACNVPTAQTCSVYQNLTGDQQSAVKQSCAGTIVTSCPTDNLVGCCAQTMGGIAVSTCYYASSARIDQQPCSTAGGTWSAGSGSGPSGDAGSGFSCPAVGSRECPNDPPTTMQAYTSCVQCIAQLEALASCDPTTGMADCAPDGTSLTYTPPAACQAQYNTVVSCLTDGGNGSSSGGSSGGGNDGAMCLHVSDCTGGDVCCTTDASNCGVSGVGGTCGPPSQSGCTVTCP